MDNSFAEKQPEASVSKHTHVEDNGLQKSETHDDLHVHNELAFKGDDSDGHVEWNTKAKIAAVSLGMLYAGKYSGEWSCIIR